ncbi:MAG: UDP-N-acetylmuramoyl-tripeptide--D-alanyl-D-alanine ligase, partial [Actinomycetota bacterium]|nr:UDP-N-acetylmuramoyl-tripeptide--D-alanyl-D-alanine ligase [Actinomycetota bacterium]
VEGEVLGDATAPITGVAIDSRAVVPGDLFVAIAGEQVDGHDFAAAAVAAGAAAVLCQRPVDGPAVVVADPVVAVGALASEVLRRLPDLTVVGVTGSSGKTSTKDLLAQVLAVAGPTVAPLGSFNNELGLPLTVLGCDRQTRFLVLEMGARGIGHISYLCGIAPPQVGLVLNVGSAHVGEFGGQPQIAQAKSEIVAGLAPDGVAVLNADDPLVKAMAGATAARVLTFGESPGSDVHVSGVTLDELARGRFTLDYAGSTAQVALHLSGEHMVSNAAAAAAVAVGLGMQLPAVAQALSAAVARSPMRMEIHRTPAGVTVINDAYNANPESVRAALKALVAMAGQGRSWAVLGEMRELGDEALAAHDSIGRLAVRLDIDRLVAVGEGARTIHLGAANEGSWGEESMWVPDVAAAQALLAAQVRPGDVVLVKASRAVGLEAVAERLLASSEGTG